MFPLFFPDEIPQPWHFPSGCTFRLSCVWRVCGEYGVARKLVRRARVRTKIGVSTPAVRSRVRTVNKTKQKKTPTSKMKTYCYTSHPTLGGGDASLELSTYVALPPPKKKKTRGKFSRLQPGVSQTENIFVKNFSVKHQNYNLDLSLVRLTLETRSPGTAAASRQFLRASTA